MSDALFTAADVFNGDPLRPDTTALTPPQIVAALTRPQRVQRVKWLVGQAHDIYHEAVDLYAGDKEIAAICGMFSGGNDSNTLMHLFRYRLTHAIHANTTVGIEETRLHVRDTCAEWNLPLIEKSGDHTFEDLIFRRIKTKKKGEDIWPGGFPGPGAHYKPVYQRLKERAFDKARHELGIANSRTKLAVWVGGRRRAESVQRRTVPLHEVDGSVIWVSPLAMWHKADLNTYRLMFAPTHEPVPLNPVTDKLHMSGECLCGAMAHPGELEEIGFWYPEFKAYIERLSERLKAMGVPYPFYIWGHGQGKPAADEPTGYACSSCASRPIPGQLDMLEGEVA